MRYKNKLLCLLSSLIAVMAFQNCGMQFPTIQAPIQLSSKNSGNGGGYEGKPDGTYYHFVPSYTCEGKPVAEQITEIRNGQAFLSTNQNNQCASQGIQVPLEDIRFSTFQTEFIMVKDALFKRYEEKPAGIPNNLAEVLCRDNFEDPTFEIVSHYDREKNQALTRVYFPYRQIPDFSVSRLLSSNGVRYVADNVTFKIDLSNPSQADRKFAGVIESTNLAGLAVQPIVCVIGGSIDTSKWALKPLTKVDAGSFELMKNNEILFFSEVSRHYLSPTLFQTVTHLMKISLDGVITDFSKAVFGEQYDIHSRNGKVGDTLYMYSAKLTSEGWTSSFVYDSDTGKAKRLTNLKPGLDPESYTFKNPVLTANRNLIYDTYIITKDLNRSLVVRKFDLNDDSVENIAALGDRNGNGYLVLPKTKKVVLYYSIKENENNILQIYSLETKSSKDLQLQLASGCVLNSTYMYNIPDENFFVATQVCDGKRNDVILVSLVDGRAQVIAADSDITWFSEDLQKIIMTSASSTNLAYDFRSGKKTNIPMDPYFASEMKPSGSTDFMWSETRTKVALTNDRYLYGFGGRGEAPTMYQVDLESGSSFPICENALGKKMYLGKLPDQKIFLFTYDAATKVYRFYYSKSTTECVRINEFPSPFPHVPSIMATNIGFGLLLGNALTVTSTNVTAEAVFVPIDGRPPLKFNPHTKGSWQMQVSEDKNRIVLRGPGADNVVRIFTFDLN